jgi:hypothetical protein
VLLAAACGRGPAEEALKAAEAALDAARPAVEKYVPAEMKALTDAAATARAQLKRGNYKAALAAAASLEAKAKAASEAARKKKDELQASFAALEKSLPGEVQALRTRLAALARGAAASADMDQETVETARANLDRLAQSWDEARQKLGRDDVVQAVEQAEKVKSQLEEMARAFLPAKRASVR